ncbi:MAG: twin-arginine translocase subunit TatC [Phycisphaerae bacterium]
MPDPAKPTKPLSPDDVRMTVGEHLEELRTRLIRALTALVVVCLLCIWPAKYLLEFIARPVVLVLRRHNQPESLLQTSPVEAILIYIKVVLVTGVVIASPYILYQIWAFVAAGLYPHERRWVTKIFPYSVGLFLTGVAFMYTLVLLVSLNFLVGFSTWIPLPSAQPNAVERVLLGAPTPPAPTTQAVAPDSPRVPFIESDPGTPASGMIWFNTLEGKLKLRAADRTYAFRMTPDRDQGMFETHFKISDYLSFVLIMTIAFGAAFQMPLVVLFLVRSGIIELQTLRSYRRLVILAIVIIAGILAPPDLLSHIMLSIPMILLFELGLLLAARKPATSEP